MNQLMEEMQNFKLEREIETKINYRKSVCCKSNLNYEIKDNKAVIFCEGCGQIIEL